MVSFQLPVISGRSVALILASSATSGTAFVGAHGRRYVVPQGKNVAGAQWRWLGRVNARFVKREAYLVKRGALPTCVGAGSGTKPPRDEREGSRDQGIEGSKGQESPKIAVECTHGSVCLSN